MSPYIWELPAWPALRADEGMLLPAIEAARRKQYHLLGALSMTPSDARDAAAIDALSSTAVDTSKIEGETLDADAVRSSVARRLGVDTGGAIQDSRTEGVVELTIDAVRNYDEPLTTERLFGWNGLLFPGTVGTPATPPRYRLAEEDPMRVLSGPYGRQRIHFEAPSGSDVPRMMEDFLRWFEASRGRTNGIVRAAIAHVWLLTIHPFHDGNGRIARAVADMALAQDEKSGDRFYSLAAQILKERDTYYHALEAAQSGTLDVTSWVAWFVATLERAVDASEFVVLRARAAALFWDRHRHTVLNARQKNVLWRLLGEFEGKLNLRKYIAIAKTSDATAQRDLSELVTAGILRPEGKGKATHYVVESTW
jgi:Fic family protein